MATKKTQDLAAAKAKKQKIVLGAAGLALLALCAIQGPKLLKGSSSPPAAPAAAHAAPATPAAAAAAVSAPAGGSATVVKVSARHASTTLAGVKIEGGGTPTPGAAQLVAFSLFEAKDPFVPQTPTETSGTTEPTSTPTLSDTETTQSGSTGGTSGSTGGTSGSTDGTSTGSTDGTSTGSTPTTATPPPPTTNATIEINNKSYPVTVKEPFPKADPLFVVASLKPKVARIGVAGGSFANAKTVPLAVGKKLVLVDDATGARYELKLVYTGTGPEQTESFTQAGK